MLSMNAGLQLILPRNVGTMLFSHPNKNELWMLRETAKRLFSVYPQLGGVLSLRCQVFSVYFLMNLTAAVEACGRLKKTVLFRLVSSSFTQAYIQEADRSLYTVTYFLSSSVTYGLSRTAKTAQITSNTLAVIFSTV